MYNHHDYVQICLSTSDILIFLAGAIFGALLYRFRNSPKVEK